MLKGKTAVVTGSTSGIGLGIARAFAARQANLLLNGFGNAAEIEKLRTSLANEFDVGVGYSAADMSKPDDITAMVAQATRELGRVDILVNNAGIQFTAPVHEFPPERWDAIIAINMSAAFHATRAALPQMLERNWGRIINISSVNGEKGQFGQSNYSAAKAGMHGFTMALALEVANKGVTVNTVAPGYIATDMVMAVREDVREKIIQTIPVKRLGRAEEIASMVGWLASDDSAFSTGAEFSINGGLHMG